MVSALLGHCHTAVLVVTIWPPGQSGMCCLAPQPWGGGAFGYTCPSPGDTLLGAEGQPLGGSIPFLSQLQTGVSWQGHTVLPDAVRPLNLQKRRLVKRGRRRRSVSPPPLQRPLPEAWWQPGGPAPPVGRPCEHVQGCGACGRFVCQHRSLRSAANPSRRASRRPSGALRARVTPRAQPCVAPGHLVSQMQDAAFLLKFFTTTNDFAVNILTHQKRSLGRGVRWRLRGWRRG